MKSEFEGVEEEPKDRTKRVWIGILVAFALMIGVLALTLEPAGDVSTVRVQHILIKADMANPADRQRAQEEATDLLNRIKKGEDMGTLAKQYSNDENTSPRGGDLGWQPRGIYDAAFEDHVWNEKTPLGDVQIVRGNQGYHIVRVIGRHWSKADAYDNEIRRKAEQEVGTSQ